MTNAATNHHERPPYFTIYWILLLLLVVTLGAALVHLGPFNLFLAMVVAVTKAILIILYFMHVKLGTRLTWIFASAAFVWLAIFLVFTFGDYLSR
jgi:cytochrome c oxidase subunit IV